MPVTEAEAIDWANLCGTPPEPCAPDVVDVCGSAGYMVVVDPTNLNRMNITVSCGQYLEAEELHNCAMVHAVHLDETTSSEIVSLNSHPDCIPAPEPGFAPGMAIAIIAIVAASRLRSRPTHDSP
jgi:hypothetical protein